MCRYDRDPMSAVWLWLIEDKKERKKKKKKKKEKKKIKKNFLIFFYSDNAKHVDISTQARFFKLQTDSTLITNNKIKSEDSFTSYV